MFEINQYSQIIKSEIGKLKNKIILKVFTDVKIREDGTKQRKCMGCNSIIDILNKLAEYAQGKIEIEEFSTEENTDLAKKFKIERIPTILFLDEHEGEVIRYIATPLGNELLPFMKTLQYYSGTSAFYKDTVMTNLNKISKSSIKLFITNTCPYCPEVLPILSLFAILSNGKITLEIIDVDANQDMAMKYQIQGVPHTVINEKQPIYGVFTPQDLLDFLTKGKQDFGGMYA